MLASPITLKNYLENDQSLKELGGNEYIAKLTRLSTSAFQSKDYAKVIYDLHLRRKLIELSENTLTEANNKNLEHTAEQLIEGTEKKLFDLAERGKFDRSYMSFEKALGETVDMAMRAFKNDEGIVGVPTGLRVRAQHSPVVVPVYATSKSGGPLVFALFDLWALVHPDFVAQVSVAKVIYVTVHVCAYNSRD